jgi:hypothetical protein
MRIEYWNYNEVNVDGTIGQPPRPHEGSVRTEPGMDTSGKHHFQSPSTKRDGLWMKVSTGRLHDGTVHGITLYFRDEAEMRDFEETRLAGTEHRDFNGPDLPGDEWKHA